MVKVNVCSGNLFPDNDIPLYQMICVNLQRCRNGKTSRQWVPSLLRGKVRVVLVDSGFQGRKGVRVNALLHSNFGASGCII